MKYNKSFVAILTIMFIVVFCILFYILFKDIQVAKENDKSNANLIEEAVEEIEQSNEKIIDWEYLKSINEDIIAWIEIEDTNINYPVLKHNDLFYLKHSYNKKYNNNGSIFTIDDKPFENKETTLYGHNTKNGSMFSTLSKYLNEDFFYSHLNLTIYTPTCNYKGTIFSAYSTNIKTENSNIEYLNFNERVNYYRNSSVYSTNNVTNSNKLLKLSTCSYINAKTRPTEQRYYIIADVIPIK